MADPIGKRPFCKSMLPKRFLLKTSGAFLDDLGAIFVEMGRRPEIAPPMLRLF